MPRLFTGLEIPPGVAQSLSSLRGGLPGARWIDPEHYHMTLRFIGDVDDVIAHEVASLLARVRRQAFELQVADLKSFGGRKPRAVVATLTPIRALMELQAEHERLMQRVGLELHKRPDRSRSEPFWVPRFVLFSSRMSVGGGPYVVEAAYPFTDVRFPMSEVSSRPEL